MKTLGQIAYEQDVSNQPTYHDGSARKTWQELGEIEKYSWERNPTPRTCHLHSRWL